MEDFNFKRALRELINKEMTSILCEQGFVLSKRTTYIREQNGLMQEFYFRSEGNKLRPWITYRPIYDARPIADFGTDSIYTHDCLNPYRGFSVIFFEGNSDNFQNQFIPRFEILKHSIINGVLPEMNKIHSLEDVIHLYEMDGLLFQKKIRNYTGSQRYYEFISKVNQSIGKKRMAFIIEEMNGHELPKIVQEYLESYNDEIATDTVADKFFDEYCNKIRIANKLAIK